MPVLHNQINLLWRDATYDKFMKHHFARKIYAKKDAARFARIGAYLITDGSEKLRATHPYNAINGFENFVDTYTGNSNIGQGAEFILKAVFLWNGYTINTLDCKNKKLHRHSDPLRRYSNIGCIDPSKTVQFKFLVDKIDKIIDFTGFDTSQIQNQDKERARLEGWRIKGIPNLSIPFPTAKSLLSYMHFMRNGSIHTPFAFPEFNGTHAQQVNLLNYIAQKGLGHDLKSLSDLKEITL